MKISNENQKKIESLREIIEVEEGKEVTIEQTLDRVLNFYAKFVPYN